MPSHFSQILERMRECATSVCKYFLFIFLNYDLLLINLQGTLHLPADTDSVDSDTDPLKEAYAKVHHYSTSTGSGTLQSHLLKCHLEAGVQGCQKQGLQLKGKEGEECSTGGGQCHSIGRSRNRNLVSDIKCAKR